MSLVESHLSINARKTENIIAIAKNAGYMLAKGVIDVNDPKLLRTEIIKWADDFERLFNPETSDYYLSIDEFSRRVLAARFTPSQ